MKNKIKIEIEDSTFADRQFIEGVEVRSTSTTTTNEKNMIKTEQTVYTATDGTGYTITIERSIHHKRK